MSFNCYAFVLFLYRFQHELQEKDKVIETLQLRLQSKADMHSVALSPFSSPSKRVVETQTSPRQVSAVTQRQKDSSYNISSVLKRRNTLDVLSDNRKNTKMTTRASGIGFRQCSKTIVEHIFHTLDQTIFYYVNHPLLGEAFPNLMRKKS